MHNPCKLPKTYTPILQFVRGVMGIKIRVNQIHQPMQTVLPRDEKIFPLSIQSKAAIIKYHRLIYRQSNSYLKYFTGHCQIKFSSSNNDYEDWISLEKHIKEDERFKNQGPKKYGLLQIWQNYNQVCENANFKPSQQNFKTLRLQRVHSNFIYNDDLTFKNLQPFNDIPKLLQQINNLKKR